MVLAEGALGIILGLLILIACIVWVIAWILLPIYVMAINKKLSILVEIMGKRKN